MGSCLCQNIKYTFTAAPCDNIPYASTGELIMEKQCSCYTCHRLFPFLSPTNSILVPRSSFNIHEIPSYYPVLKSYTYIDAKTSIQTINHFCSNCGSGVYRERKERPFDGMAIVNAKGLDRGNLWDAEGEVLEMELGTKAESGEGEKGVPVVAKVEDPNSTGFHCGCVCE